MENVEQLIEQITCLADTVFEAEDEDNVSVDLYFSIRMLEWQVSLNYWHNGVCKWNSDNIGSQNLYCSSIHLRVALRQMLDKLQARANANKSNRITNYQQDNINSERESFLLDNPSTD